MRNLLRPLRPESGHLLHLDALRLIASAGIVVGHVIVFVDAGPDATWPRAVQESLSMFVDMFFVISGFVIAFVYSQKMIDVRSFGLFLRKRLARLAPLHWLTLALFIGIGMFARAHHFGPNHDNVYDLDCAPVSFFFLNSTGLCPHQSFNSVSWSISAEMIMYLCSPALFWVRRRSGLGLLAIVIVSLVGLTWLLPDRSWLTLTHSGGVLRAVPSFTLGVLFYSLRASLARISIARPGFWIGILAYVAGVISGAAQPVLLVLLYATVAFGIGADAQQRSGRFVSALAAGGQLTYSSYMLHLLVILVLLNGLADRILVLHGLQRNLLVVLAFALVWPLSYLSLMLFERPAREWLDGRRPRARQPAAIAAQPE